VGVVLALAYAADDKETVIAETRLFIILDGQKRNGLYVFWRRSAPQSIKANKGGKIMLNLIKKTMLTGVGLAGLTKNKVEKLAKELAKKGKLSEKEGKKLVDDLLKKSEKARKDLEAQIEKVANNTMKKMNFATREDMLNLTKRIKNLERSLKVKGLKD
jgi:polyhydroxyalkanoate synthesis regulator phasin